MPSSSRGKLYEIKRFFESIDNSYIESYLIQISERLSTLVSNLNFNGCDPKGIKEFLMFLQSSRKDFISLKNNVDLEKTIHELKIYTATLYAYVGDYTGTVTILDEKYEKELPVWMKFDEKKIRLLPEITLESLKERSSKRGENIFYDLLRIEEMLGKEKIDKANTAVIPVIDRGMNGENQDGYIGCLRHTSLEIFGEVKNNGDEIHWDVSVFCVESNKIDIIDSSVLAARKLLSETFPILNKKYFSGRVVFEESHILHEGSSANLAIAGLIYCAILKYVNNREQYQISAKTAITGDIDINGIILPVDQDTLSAKVKAVFFSWIENLVVPKSQQTQAEGFLIELKNEYQNRELKIFGISELKELFYDRRLTNLKKIGAVRYNLTKIWKRKFSIAGITIISILTLIIARLVYGPIDKNPVLGEFKGTNLLVKNKQNETIEEIYIGKKTVETVKSYSDLNAVTSKYVKFYDIDKDGTNEIFYIIRGSEENGFESKLLCKDIKKDSLLWSKIIRKKLNFPFKTDVQSENFFLNDFLIGDFENDGRIEIFLLAANLNAFPSLIIKLDGKTGNELDHYSHIGHISSLVAVDLDKDGISDILAVGGNNAFDQACFVVLDSRYISGCSPTQGDYILKHSVPGVEKKYILFPPTIVGNLYKKWDQSRGTVGGNIEILSSDSLIKIDINDIFNATQHTLPFAGIYIYFDYNFKPVRVGTANGYDVLAKNRFEQGYLKKRVDYKYLEEYKKTLLYWNGTTFQNEPCMNKRYLEVVGQLSVINNQ
jgi:hypothetical protein